MLVSRIRIQLSQCSPLRVLCVCLGWQWPSDGLDLVFHHEIPPPAYERTRYFIINSMLVEAKGPRIWKWNMT